MAVRPAQGQESGLPALEETGQVSFVPVELSQPDAAEELIAAAAHRGGIDVLVNNVGAATVRRAGSRASPTTSGRRRGI
ncbi:hypothetical protein [Mycobacterium sp.]|uniref:hypothetical protein n=1 Tax=Mycobacterium sp. TaxID=1785 RepID=UPI003F9E56F3